MAFRPVRTGRARRPHLGPRRGRRQGADVDARQGVRGDVCHGDASVQREVHARRRRGDRFAEPLRILPAVQKVAQGRRDPRLGHLDALDADPVDHLRPARPGLHGGRGGGAEQGPPFGAVRRCGGQPGQRAGASGGATDRRRGARDDPRILRRRAGTYSRRKEGLQPGSVQPRGVQEVARDRRRGGRGGLHDARTHRCASLARRKRHLGRLHGRRDQDGDSVEGVGQDFDAAGSASGLPEDFETFRTPLPAHRPPEREGHREGAARRNALRRSDRHAGL